MRLVRYLFVLIVVLSTSAWTAPTQPELPGSWPRAALLTQPATAERDLRVTVGRCDLAVQGPAAGACDSAAAYSDQRGCAQGLACRQGAGRGAGRNDRDRDCMPSGLATRSQINVAFSNLSDRG
ncbi:hypothetical protein [Xanthomonas hortorum]|uniref:hypothetical protein n=1 Tax=Xanthomonas hortorum TaxID=56454 RepID=UPI0015D5BBCF|nr:hypothetical protein [Xanthomonas hortorum]MCE4312330.1 hypothetical protein [Xanthomonas hortorum pv. vitians]MCE4343097.1 hypothetical protein [Xanthomonas hortorum pv. vitians]